MRATHSVEEVFGNRSRVRVLRVLNAVSVPLHTARVASLAGLSKPAAATALDELERMGLVASSPAGRSTVYWLVRESAYVQGIVQASFGFESDVPDMLESDLKAWFSEDALSIVLFGSYARGDQQRASDVDLVLVAGDETSKARLDDAVDRRGAEFRTKYGASLSPIVYSASEAGDLWLRAPELFESIAKDGVVVHGLRPREWQRHDQEG